MTSMTNTAIEKNLHINIYHFIKFRSVLNTTSDINTDVQMICNYIILVIFQFRTLLIYFCDNLIP